MWRSCCCFWPPVVVLLDASTNYYPQIYAQILLVNSAPRWRKGAIFTNGAMREFPITLRQAYKASQQLVPWQWIWKARMEGIIWFPIYSSGQFLQQSILINKLKPSKKKQKAFESFQLQQAWSRLYGSTQTPWTLLLWKIYFYLGFKIDSMLLPKHQNTF